MNLIQQYEQHSESGNWEAGLNVINQIIEQSPEVSTSWFNKGVCLDELERHNEAAEAFIKAQEIELEDWGIHYRILRSAFLAQNAELFFGFAEYSIGLNIDILNTIEKEDLFKPILSTTYLTELKAKFT